MRDLNRRTELQELNFRNYFGSFAVATLNNMSTNKTDGTIALRRVLGSRPPEKITQEAHEGNPKHLLRLSRLHPGERPDVSDLWEYTQDLLYTEIQGPLFTYLLPFCLKAWHEDLRGERSEFGGFVEYLYPVLANREVFNRHLTSTQTAAVSEFMRESILEEIDDQRGLAYVGSGTQPYRWVTALTTQGVLLPDVGRLWTAWWSVATTGRAIAAVQYISCLMYSKDENPVFAPWTGEAGGGPPCLWEFAGHLYTNRWREENVRFLRQTLHPQGASEVLSNAVTRLVNEPEYPAAAEIQADLPLRADTLAARCAELPNLLERTEGSRKIFEWSS